MLADIAVPKRNIMLHNIQIPYSDSLNETDMN
jgi:hypothetical protein